MPTSQTLDSFSGTKREWRCLISKRSKGIQRLFFCLWLLGDPLCYGGATLNIADDAPKLASERWWKGDPIFAFEPNTLYIVEFWGTLCGPCVDSIPKLTELQKRYQNSGVVVIGVAAHEMGATTEAKLASLNTFLEKKWDEIGYRIAFEGTGAAKAAWMTAADQRGIPTAFVVQKGKIVFIGHPVQLEEAIPQILAGSWDPASMVQAIARRRLQQERMDELASQYHAASEGKRWEDALRFYDQILDVYPEMRLWRTPEKIRLLMFQLGRYSEAYALIDRCAIEQWDNPFGLDLLLSVFYDKDHPPKQSNEVLKKKLGKRLLQLSSLQSDEARAHPALIQYLVDLEDWERAVQYQRIRIEFLAKSDGSAEFIKGQRAYLASLELRLAEKLNCGKGVEGEGKAKKEIPES